MMNDSLWADVAKALDALSPVFLAFLGWLSVQVTGLINTRVKDDRVRAMLQRLDDAVFTAVREVEQVYVTTLKLESADGVLTPIERNRAKETAVRAARTYFGSKGFIELGKVLGLSREELERVLAARVESAVFQLKAQPRVLTDAAHQSQTRFDTLPPAPPPASPAGPQGVPHRVR